MCACRNEGPHLPLSLLSGASLLLGTTCYLPSLLIMQDIFVGKNKNSKEGAHLIYSIL